jgi:hypothetical protein
MKFALIMLVAMTTTIGAFAGGTKKGEKARAKAKTECCTKDKSKCSSVKGKPDCCSSAPTCCPSKA